MMFYPPYLYPCKTPNSCSGSRSESYKKQFSYCGSSSNNEESFYSRCGSYRLCTSSTVPWQTFKGSFAFYGSEKTIFCEREIFKCLNPKHTFIGLEI